MIQWLKEKDRLMEKLNKQEILQVTRKINANNFYDFMERYDLTYGELLRAIDFQIHSSSSLLMENSLRNLLKQKQILFCVNEKKVGLFADFHAGHTQANWDYIYRGYDFCFEEGIDTIIILGDLLHGPYKWASNNYNKAIFQCYQQLVELQEHLPKGFSTFLLGGNHEEEFYKVGIDPWQQILSMRDDIFPISRGRCYVQFGNFILNLNHNLPSRILIPPEMDCDLSLYGHFHTAFIHGRKASITTCSDLKLTKTRYKFTGPGFSTLTDFDDQLQLHGYTFEENDIVLQTSKTYQKKRKTSTS